jgi:hypothetical protein
MPMTPAKEKTRNSIASKKLVGITLILLIAGATLLTAQLYAVRAILAALLLFIPVLSAVILVFIAFDLLLEGGESLMLWMEVRIHCLIMRHRRLDLSNAMIQEKSQRHTNARS